MNQTGSGSVVPDMSMSPRRRLAVQILPLLGAAVLAVAGCAGPTAPAASGAAAGSFTIQGYRFPALTAAPGATITLIDGDGEPHTVTADDHSFDSGSFDSSAPGKLVAPTRPGSYPIHCTVHPSMHGTLTVH